MHRTVLEALFVAADGLGNEGAWATLGQLLGFMFSQRTHGSSCLTSDAPKGSLRGTFPVSLLELDWWEAACGGILLHIMPQGHGRGGPWWAEMVVMIGSSRWCWPYVVVHGIGGLIVGSLCGLGGWSVRQG